MTDHEIPHRHPDHEEVTFGDLLKEGRKYVFVAGKETPEGITLVEVAVEEYPLKFKSGLVSNDPNTKPPLAIPPEVEDPIEYCQELSINYGLCKDGKEYLMIVASSMRAYHLSARVQVKYNEASDQIWLADGFGNELVLDEERSLEVYRKIADIYHLERRPDCPNCGTLLDCDQYCESCGEGGEPSGK